MENAPAKSYLESDAAVMTDEDRAWQTYVGSRRELAPARAPRPCGIRFHGDTGKYSLSYFDAQARETAFVNDIGLPHGVILAVRWLCKWKFDPNGHYDILTREFEAFKSEPIELLKIDRNAARDAEFQTTRYEDYQAFKLAMGMKDPITGDVKYPFDLTASIYLFAPQLENPQGAKVFRYRFAGSTRSAFFDYLKGGVAEYVTVLGVSDPQEMATKDEKTGEAKTFYTGTFTRMEVPPEMRRGVMDAYKEIRQWLDEGPKKKDGGHEARPAIAAAPAPAQLSKPAFIPPEAEDVDDGETESTAAQFSPVEVIPFKSTAEIEAEKRGVAAKPAPAEAVVVPAVAAPAEPFPGKAPVNEVQPERHAVDTPSRPLPNMSPMAALVHYQKRIEAAKNLVELDGVYCEWSFDKVVLGSNAAMTALTAVNEKKMTELMGIPTKPLPIEAPKEPEIVHDETSQVAPPKVSKAKTMAAKRSGVRPAVAPRGTCSSCKGKGTTPSGDCASCDGTGISSR